MDTFDSARQNILNISNDITRLLSEAALLRQMEINAFETWEGMCRRIGQQISEEILRVAVVGPIKSGKSTFVNSLLSNDYLKRGAGVVTSIVTRIRKGNRLNATLFFKSWDEVNADIEQAIAFFPVENWRSEKVPFDIRRNGDRAELRNALATLGADLVLDSGTLNANCLLLSYYLDGYDFIKNHVNSENRQVTYDNDLFAEHKTFVGNDALSVYLKDIQLNIDSDVLKNNVEIADCQGSDSPNPLHLAMIQDYLVLAHLIVYVISSRTGLREADIRFLSMIKKMGIIDNILFIVNCDFNEHDSLDDLSALVGKTEQDLSIIKPEPVLFCFSSLFSLFQSRSIVLSEKDQQRLAQWEKSVNFAKFSLEQREGFLKEFNRRIVQDRLSLLLKNHLERLGVVSSQIGHWIDVNQEILSGDLEKAEHFIHKIEQHEEKIGGIKRLIKDTLDGAVQKLIDELKRETDRFFSSRNENILNSALDYVKNYQVTITDYETKLLDSGFNATLYALYQEFKNKVDLFMAESVNPRIIHFLKEQERRISEFLASVAAPYEGMVLDAVKEYNETVTTFGVTPIFITKSEMGPVDMDQIKQMVNIKIPPAEATMRYSAKIKTDAVIRLGFYSAVKMIKKLFKKPIQNEREDSHQALRDSVRMFKREMEKSIIEQFKNYRENIKFQYLLTLVNSASSHIFQEVSNRFQAYQTDLSKLTELINDKGTTKADAVALLKTAGSTATEIAAKIDDTRYLVEDTTR